MKSTIVNEVNIKLLSKSVNESFARTAVSAFISQLDPTIEELADIRTSVSEAVTNSIIHGYSEKQGIVYISVKYYSDRTVKIIVKDKGCGIEDIEKAMEPLFTTDKSGERGGMGFAIMNSFTDKLTVTSKPYKGTTVTMIKRLN